MKTSAFPLQLYEWFFEDGFTIGGRGFPYHLEDFEAYPCAPEQPGLHRKTRMEAPWYQSDADVFSLFKVSVYTSTKLFLSQQLLVCHPERLHEFTPSKLQLPQPSLLQVICALFFRVAALI